jgi:hypothetical protein
METRHQDRLEQLLDGYAEQCKVKKLHPRTAAHRNWAFRDRYSNVVRQVMVPVLQKTADQLRGKVESCSIFHRLHAAGIKLRVDAWDDYDRELVFFGDESTETVRVAHEGKGFAYETLTLDLSEVTASLVEAEIMEFLDRVLELEPKGLPFEPRKPAEIVRMPAAVPGEAGGEGLERRVATAAGPQIA